MEQVLLLATLSTLFLTGTQAYLKFCDQFPRDVDACFAEAHRHPIGLKEAHIACVRKYYMDSDPDLNITRSDRAFFDLRVKHKYGLVPPPTGFRVRKEYRRLTKDERIRLHTAFNVLYKKGVVHRFGRLHASATESIHDGAAFLPWHRVFIADFEEELRRVDPTVSLAYWDYTIDNNITRPSDSVLWSPCFFGNGNGTIVEGPFRGWYGGRNGPLQRDFGRDACDGGRLVNKFDVLNVLSKCHLGDISSPPETGTCNLEILHDGPHQWTGGDMNDLQLSAFDPIFYFHHAFTDHVWELFRRNQAFKCNVNPETDYPPDHRCGPTGQRAYDRMYGYEHLRNIDGLTNILPTMYYNYEPFPTCPDCGPSEFLYCDFKQQICLTRERDSCDMRRSPSGGHTYTGRENDGIGFGGELASTFTEFIPKHPPRSLRGDGRHRDMSRQEANRILREESKINFATGTPFARLMPLMPSTFSRQGASPSRGLSYGSNMALGGFDINGKSLFPGGFSRLPINYGFIPFQSPENQSMNYYGTRPYRTSSLSFGFPRFQEFSGFDIQPPMRNFYNFSPQVGKGYY